MTDLHLELKHIQKSYLRPVLSDVNLDVTNDSYVTIVGKSGSGKSTMLNILGLVEGYDRGEYWFNGKLIRNGIDYARLRLENIGFTGTQRHLIGDLVQAPARIRALAVKAAHRQADLGQLSRKRGNAALGCDRGEKEHHRGAKPCAEIRGAVREIAQLLVIGDVQCRVQRVVAFAGKAIGIAQCKPGQDALQADVILLARHYRNAFVVVAKECPRAFF